MSIVEQEDVQPSDLVVVGSSAGGVEALSILVSTLPANFPAPLVLAQHLDPNRPSSLDSILQKRTRLIVEVVQEDTKLQAGRIYVVPSNRHVSINDHHVQLADDRLKRPRPSVDTLLSTAAKFYGDHLIAVILTGSGSDGAIGAVDVKNAGGIVIVQDPQTARYPSMPLALPPTVIDFEVSIEQIGPLLYDLLTGVNIPQAEERTEDVLREILELVSRQASIDFRPYKTSTILRRISRRMAVTHNRSMRDYADYLKLNPDEIGNLVKAFLINVTQFFRDADAFAYLRSDVLPALIAHARERDHVLRLWTAGCATGEEPYSLAMLLTDLLGAELPEWSVKIFATDLDEAAITFARRGLYSENLLKGVPSRYRALFFERVDHGYHISKTLRQMVIFGQQDLSRSAPFPRIDLVLCRNVLIYFTPELQDYVLNQFAFSLSPNGYLFLGKAETVHPMQTFYELVNKHWKVYRCVGNALPSARQQGLSELGTSHVERNLMNRPNRPLRNSQPDQERQPLSLEQGQFRYFNELLLRFLPIGVVIIDRTYHVLTANGTARRLLGLRDAAIDQDFLHAVRGIPYHDTRSAIDAVFQARNFITLPEVELQTTSGGNGRFINFSIALMQLEAGLPELAAISVTDVTEQVQIRRQLETVQAEQTQLMQELGTANKRLSDMNKELMDANEELQVANEELMLTHEELQASIEEFETTNEELQATNEELETNNEELQATNEELETTNDELRARTGELQELATIMENERVRLVSAVEITEQVHARKDFEQFETTKDDFLSLATHELRSPLTSIQENTQLLQSALKRHIASMGQEQAHEQDLDQGLMQIDHILHQLGNMNDLITEMLDVAHLREEVFELHLQENVDLVALVRNVAEQLGTQSPRISVHSSEKSIQVTLDEDRIEQVLNNLLSNAIKYSPNGSSIEVTVDRNQDTNEAAVAVRDEGDGIQEEDQLHIFERFYRVRTDAVGRVDGLGLGLYIAYGIVKQHGGRMWLVSHPDQGSTFFFALPLEQV